MMRDLEKDLEIYQKATPGPVGLLEPLKPDHPDSVFIQEAWQGWPEAISRAIAAESELKNLKGYIAMSEVNCTAAYNDLQQDRDVAKAKLFLAEEKLGNLQIVLQQRVEAIECLKAEVERLQKELSFLASQAKIVHSIKHENLLTYKTFPIIVENRCNKALGVVVDADS